MSKRTIVWFRNDLRLSDNEVVQTALKSSEEVFFLYCLDLTNHPEMEGFKTPIGFHRIKFLLESIKDLKTLIENCGSSMIFKLGKPELTVPEIALILKADKVLAQKEVTDFEVKQEQSIELRLLKINCDLELIWGSTLFHIHDLPFPIKNLPPVFTSFRNKVEKYVDVRRPFEQVLQLNPSRQLVESDPIPCTSQFCKSSIEPNKNSAFPFLGGETEGLKRLTSYLWETKNIQNYKETRNQLIGSEYSSKLSAYLSLGCLSARTIFWELKKFEKTVIKNESTYWLFFELLWRDFFKFTAKKFGNQIFKVNGFNEHHNIKFKQDLRLFNLWKEGKTGIPFIDANMRELAQTGFMSNRGRQNVASFLVKDLEIDWRWGASFFESQLVDYDPSSNWCNWLYIAGLGNDPRENRRFNILSQSERYDPQGEYVKTWCPELITVPKELINFPSLMSDGLQIKLNVEIGKNYPAPIVPKNHWDALKNN